MDRFFGVTAAVRSPFFAMDLARRRDGGRMIVEIGDGRVSGAPRSFYADRFYKALCKHRPGAQEDRLMIRNHQEGDHDEWLRMRRALWDDCPEEQQLREMDEILARETEEVFLAERPEGGLCGFVEVSIRPWAIGCEPRPVGYLEGWYVDEDIRRRAVGRTLVEVAEAWAGSKGCRQMASDAELWNVVSQQAHAALGYEETGRLVHFKKEPDR